METLLNRASAAHAGAAFADPEASS
jgi:hypothetical protein